MDANSGVSNVWSSWLEQRSVDYILTPPAPAAMNHAPTSVYLSETSSSYSSGRETLPAGILCQSHPGRFVLMPTWSCPPGESRMGLVKRARPIILSISAKQKSLRNSRAGAAKLRFYQVAPPVSDIYETETHLRGLCGHKKYSETGGRRLRPLGCPTAPPWNRRCANEQDMPFPGQIIWRL